MTADLSPRVDGIPRVAIIDDDTVIRLGTPMLLPRSRLAGAYADVAGFIEASPDADVVLLDLTLAGSGAVNPQQGLVAVRAVCRTGYRTLIYTNERRRIVLANCLAAGARGIVHKAEPIADLQTAIDCVSSGAVTITTALAGLAEVIDRHGELPTLTPRQHEVLALRARGEPFQTIARKLGISNRTAEEHMAEVAKKFSRYLTNHSSADLERHLGLDGDDPYTT